jgi:hypothetical protein
MIRIYMKLFLLAYLKNLNHSQCKETLLFQNYYSKISHKIATIQLTALVFSANIKEYHQLMFIPSIETIYFSIIAI